MLRLSTADIVSSHLRSHSWDLLLLPQNIRLRPKRRNTQRINLLMTLGIMILNMHKIRRILKRRYIPIQMPQPFMEVRVAGADVADVALEVLDVDDVETDDGGVEADVGFGEAVAEVVGTRGSGELGFGVIEGFEEDGYVVRVGFLGAAGVLVNVVGYGDDVGEEWYG